MLWSRGHLPPTVPLDLGMAQLFGQNRPVTDESHYIVSDSSTYEADAAIFHVGCIQADDIGFLWDLNTLYGVRIRTASSADEAFRRAYIEATQEGTEIDFGAHWETMVHGGANEFQPHRWKLVVQWEDAGDEHVLGIEVAVMRADVQDALYHAVQHEMVILQLKPNTAANHGVVVRPQRGDLLHSLVRIRESCDS